ncbi:hypothetical protein F511_31913 [Dorcoceras hygrometricum]|uniref:Uncharacterized protein n=1 Tax=Dorcoceras hygrometricum TaxID=472368 RepID=A0A2Z7D1U2_9LAMI|nr:hypothetical protein F511_31913 [Dorcoceras hygrometricum]
MAARWPRHARRNRAPPCATIAHSGRPVRNDVSCPACDDACAIARAMAPPCTADRAPPCATIAHGARLRPDSQGICHFKVGGGRSPQSGPRLDARVLRQSALEELKNFARTESPRQGDRNKSDHGGGTAARALRTESPRQGDRNKSDHGRRHGGAARGKAAAESTCVTLNGSGIQLAVGPQPLRLRNHNFGHAHRIMVKRLATSPHDPLGITDSACKNQLVVVSVQYGPFNTYIPIRSTTIGRIPLEEFDYINFYNNQIPRPQL